MSSFTIYDAPKSARIGRLIDHIYGNMPQIEADRGVLLTESYRATEGEPMITRRSKAFYHILENIPITIRPEELVVGSTTVMPRSAQVFPEYSYEWLEEEFETIATRSADPFYISEDTKAKLREAYKYWKGRTSSELATSYMSKEALRSIEHNIFTPGNYFYNGVGHVSVQYDKVLRMGYSGIRAEAQAALDKLHITDSDFVTRRHFLEAVILSCDAAILYARRYAALAAAQANECTDPTRRRELNQIAENCRRVPEFGANSFWEACQSFWFVQMLIQTESSGHSVSPGRFDQYMYPYYKADLDAGRLTPEFAQELIDCVWVKLNDMCKVRDAASAAGFAGYSMFQNLIVGGQNERGEDVTNDLSFMCLQASMHTQLPAPSLSIRIWNGTPHDLLIKAGELTRTGIGLPAYYNDEVIIPALVSRGLTLQDARNYCVIGCVEPQCPGKTEGWHDAAFFNMCRIVELVFQNGMDAGEMVGIATGDITKMTSFQQVFDAYQKQTDYQVELMVNADNAIDVAHAERCPLPFLSSMIEDCIGRGLATQCGGAKYNFTGPQGFGVANMADGLYAIRELVFNKKEYTLADFKEAMEHNFGVGAVAPTDVEHVTTEIVKGLVAGGQTVGEKEIAQIASIVQSQTLEPAKRDKYMRLRESIQALPKFGNDIEDIDALAREVAYTYTRSVENYENPRGGIYQAGLYPVSANVPLGAQTGATPDGRLAYTPVADGVSPVAGSDTSGPTAAANSVARLDHHIASNGTLYNMKFHPSALAGRGGLENFAALIRTYFEKKGSHMQFNVVSRETLLDAQAHPENYKALVVRVAGYSALFTTLSRSLQDDIINRTEQKGWRD
ncbi:MAG: glycyl radical protein [Clostridia bacterium]|nr:glycyl radical protein [Clostridia bacterium]